MRVPVQPGSRREAIGFGPEKSASLLQFVESRAETAARCRARVDVGRKARDEIMEAGISRRSRMVPPSRSWKKT